MSEEEVFEWSGVVVHCAVCGDHVELLTDELEPDGTAPDGYVCGVCE